MNKWNDFGYVLEKVKLSGMSLAFASASLQDNEDIVYSAIVSDGIAMSECSERLKNHYYFTLKCVEVSPTAAPFVGDNLWQNKMWVKNAVSINALVFLHLPNKFKYYKHDKDICLLAAKEHSTVEAMDKNLLKQLCFAEQLIEANPICLKMLANIKDESGIKYNQNMKLCLLACTKCAYAYSFVSDDLKNSYEFALVCVSNNSNVYYYLNNNLKRNKNIILNSIKGDASILKDIPADVCTSPFLADILCTNADAINYISKQDKNQSLIYELLTKNANQELAYLVMQDFSNCNYMLEIQK